jgi:hypothetical protein
VAWHKQRSAPETRLSLREAQKKKKKKKEKEKKAKTKKSLPLTIFPLLSGFNTWLTGLPHWLEARCFNLST